MQLRLRHNNVTFTFVERLPECTLYTDKNRLIQLLANFIVNAIKFTEVGTIRMGYRLLDSETIYFYVSDTGCGMSSEQCIHVFERFVKYNSFVQGTGLGLFYLPYDCRPLGRENRSGVERKQRSYFLVYLTLSAELMLYFSPIYQ